MKQKIISLMLALAVILSFGTVTTAAETAVPVFCESMPLANAKKPSPPATISNLNNETFVKYTTILDKHKPVSYKNVYLYDFNTSLSAGIGEGDISLPTEANYGVTGKINGRKINAIIYDHTGTHSVKAIRVEGLDNSSNLSKKLSLSNNKLQLDTTNYSNGLYRLFIGFNNSQKAVKLNFYINGNKTYFCQLENLDTETAQQYKDRRTALAKVLKDGKVTPQNSVSLDKVYYPFRKFKDGTLNSKWRCDTQRWIDLSNEIVEDNWSDEYKLLKMYTWICENIAFDDYVKNTTNKSRAQYFKDFSGKYSVYNTKAGVCFDYSHIFAIMCRAHNIPAITIGSTKDNHVWNVVYINNRWMEVDFTSSEQYHVGKDTSVRKATNEPLYGGICNVLPQRFTPTMPSDATANQYWQYNTNNVY